MEQFSIISWIAQKAGLTPLWAQRYQHVIMSVFVLAVIALMSFFAWLKLKDTRRRIIPEKRGAFANIFEVIVEEVLEMMDSLNVKNARVHIPLIGSLFVYILISNLFGIIPGFMPPTDNINTNLACAVCVFFYYNIAGIRTQGFKKYLKSLAGPIVWLFPLMFMIEVVSHLVRPLSLSVRLFGNITGDHMVLGIFSSIVPFLVPIIFMGLAIFVAFIQAFVFTLLSIVYIALATSDEGH